MGPIDRGVEEVNQHEQKSSTGGGKVTLQPGTLAAIEALILRYPEKEAALIPILHAVQDDLGHISVGAMEWVAGHLALPYPRVLGVVSFYTMFRRSPAGSYRLDICTNLSCSLMGAEHLRDHLCQKLGIKPGETTDDGQFTLNEVECLGSCGTAPVMLVNDEFHENLDPAKIDTLIENLKRADPKKNSGGDAS